MLDLEKINDNEKDKLADELFNSLCVGINISVDKNKLNELNILNEKGCTEFRPTLHMIIKICSTRSTKKQRELLARAYSWLGSEYRMQAIEHLSYYLYNDLNISKREPYPMFTNGQQVFNINDKDSFICRALLWDLSGAYEKEYQFDEALHTLNLTWYLFPYCYTTLAKKLNIYRKMNKLDNAINAIREALTEEWTQPYTYIDLLGREYFTDSNKRSLLNDLEKYEKLKQKGYIYKPRPRKKQ